MTSTISELSSHLKGLLYRCMESLQATKAAFYMTEGGSPYRVAASYGFNAKLVEELPPRHPVVERLLLSQKAFFVNGVAADPRIASVLFDVNTDRILVAPIFFHGQLLGFLDLRDKSGGKPFTHADLQSVMPILRDIFDFLSSRGAFGVKVSESRQKVSPEAKLIEMAGQVVSRRITNRPVTGEMLSESQINTVTVALQTIFAVPGVILAAFSAFGHLGNVQPVVVDGQPTPDALAKLDQKLRAWLEKQGAAVPDAGSPARVTLAPTGSGRPINGARLASILSAPVKIGAMKGLVLSVGFEQPPDRETQKLLTPYLDQVQETIRSSISTHSVRAMRQRVAEKLLEPDFETYPELVEHSRRVSALAEQLAHHHELPPDEIEMIRLAGLVHDVGMRKLDYDEIYTKPELSEAEKKLVTSHPVVSAALTADSPLGAEIGRLVLYHHERVDGTGYPEGLRGEQIPRGARILAICEAFIAMTTSTYQPAMPESAALIQLERNAGSQFDAEYARGLAEMLASEHR